MKSESGRATETNPLLRRAQRYIGSEHFTRQFSRLIWLYLIILSCTVTFKYNYI
jgi:hypothetical protein